MNVFITEILLTQFGASEMSKVPSSVTLLLTCAIKYKHLSTSKIEIYFVSIFFNKVFIE